MLTTMEEKKDYLRIMRHDIKGPLTVIKGYLSFWESDTYTKFSPEKQKEFILKAMEGTRKMEQKIDEIFTELHAIQAKGELGAPNPTETPQ